MRGLAGRTALVTGCRRGIGRGFAQALTEAGADIVGVSASLEPSGSEVEKDVAALGRNFRGYACDFSDRQALYAFIEQVKKVDPKVFLVGFKAEYDLTEEELLRRAKKRMGEADMDLIVANDVSKDQVGFGTDTNEVFIIDRGGEVTHVPLKSKREVAEKLLKKVKEKMTG